MSEVIRHEVIIITGPTAIGKTAVSIALARAIGAEIISADSRQVYIGLDIGTAKPSMSERGGVRHHLIDIVAPQSDFTVADFQRLAFEALDEIHRRGKRALIVGGTGLYVRALADRPSFQGQPPIPELRREILEEIARRGAQSLYDELARLDSEAASKIHPNNIPRLVRALEVIRATGRPFSEGVRTDRDRPDESDFLWRIIGLSMDREALYRRINQRVIDMIHQGWLDEVRDLLQSSATGNEKPLMGLGYKDVVDHIRGRQSLDSAIERIQRDTRRFAKRQLTYFRTLKGIQWIDLESPFDPFVVAGTILESL